MINYPYYANQSFFQILSDAIHFSKLSKATEGQYISQRFARASIINSCLTIECAANCCLASIDYPKALFDDIEKLSSFSKFDLYSESRDSGHIDRGNHLYQKVNELKKIRDFTVHPKKKQLPIEFTLDREKSDPLIELGIEIAASPMPATKIDQCSIFWHPRDAQSALEAIIEFYNYYFLTLLRLNHAEILGLLGNLIHIKKDNAMLFEHQSLSEDLEYLVTIGIKQKFIDLSSVREIAGANL